MTRLHVTVPNQTGQQRAYHRTLHAVLELNMPSGADVRHEV